ncbi:hypothetical protein LOK49_LG07G01347 [Camellia lanceoleosa]|uniref:Uncharacterized protein n=1 Tax=Camellia lanceoleosa TaxID=1840588 RepID=A0ACC0H5C2_9ERIC|nr:hypothetical protein LOK49_LG07G01347 [Camellia lanceoleosa]
MSVDCVVSVRTQQTVTMALLGLANLVKRNVDPLLKDTLIKTPMKISLPLWTPHNPNDHDHGSKAVEERMLAGSKDHIQVGMAANLRDFVVTNYEGQEVKGSEVCTYDGIPVAYALSPIETINYVSAHDNETLFDIVSLKGIPFFHSGDEILRSKSLDRDSYNSGDWFNRIKPRLADPSFKPQSSHILAAVENFLNVLQIRYSSPLFRLRTANAIQQRVRFHNTGPSWVPGVIVMSIEDGHEGVPGLSQLDPIYSYIVVIVNVCPTAVSFANPALRARTFELHPIQAMSTDEFVKNSMYEALTGSFTVPSRTTAVFVEPRNI